MCIRDRNIINQKFGRLLVVLKTDERQQGQIVWKCLCECGKYCFVKSDHLRRGAIKSCGCLKSESTIRRFTRHGMSKSEEYKTWKKIQTRCSPNNKYRKDYYDRGISVAKEWIGAGGFVKFFNHIGPKPTPKHTIDRINNDDGYKPGNVRWATMKEQMQNQRPRKRLDLYTTHEIIQELRRRGYTHYDSSEEI